MSHVILADDGTMTLAEGSTIEDIALPEIPSLVETIIEQQAIPDAAPPTQEEVDAIEAEAAHLTQVKKSAEQRLETLKGIMRRIPKDGGGLKVSAGLTTPTLISDELVEAQYPYDAIDTEDVVVTGPRGGKKVETRLVFPNRRLYKVTVDKTAVKKHLEGDALEAVQVDGTTRVAFK